MTPEQALFQVQRVAARVLDRSGAYLFSVAGEVGTGSLVTIDMSREQMGRLPAPCVILNLGGETADQEVPRVSATLSIEALLFVERISNPYGTEQLREMLRIQDLLLADVLNVTKMCGVQMLCPRKSPIRPAPVDSRPLAYRALSFEARNVGTLSETDRLPPVTSFDGSVSGTTVTLTWTRPKYYAYRYDYLGVIVRHSTSGAITAVTDGTSVQTATDNATVAHTGTVGTNYYGAFVAYDTDGDGTADSYSPVATTTETVV